MPSKKDVTFLTSNDNKFKEVQAILGDEASVLRCSLDLVEIQGNLQDICKFKCRKAADAISGPVLVDDTSLSFNALNGLPGPYILHEPIAYLNSNRHTRKWFIEALGSQNLHKLLEGFADKSAEAICIFAYCEGPKEEPRLFEGRTKGWIVSGRGGAGFGWDSAFEVDGQTYAEMNAETKNQLSHRFKALKSFRTWYTSL